MAISPKSVSATARSREPLSDEKFLTSLGTRVRDLRSERDLSRKVLAEAAEVSERYLAQLELGSGNASVTLLRRVATALNVPLTYLMACSMSTERSRVYRFIDSLPDQRLPELLMRMAAEFGTEESVRRKRIALIGLRGAGKSTLGRALAREMHRPFVELDREIEAEAGMPLSEVFMLYGQAGYRNLERQCLERLIASQNDVVMSVGGGVVNEAVTYQVLLSHCFTVWIKALPTEHMARVVAQGDLRPMRGHSQAMEDLKGLLTAREPQYARANAVVDTSGQTVAKSLSALRLVVAARNYDEPS
jgi:XRE family aerobic/anaerobic benzoate catabolism transcriptional regulator